MCGYGCVEFVTTLIIFVTIIKTGVIKVTRVFFWGVGAGMLKVRRESSDSSSKRI